MSLLCPSRVRNERTADGALLWRAPAKINLTLRVLGRRDDGYHELDSVVAKVTLYDELLFRPRRDGKINLVCCGLDCGAVQENLILRAAELLPENRPGVDIELTKRIPAGAGLGGGSSDAAATLLALNQLWELHLSAEQLADLAGRLGSDVPLFLAGPTVRIRGRGELVEPVRVHPFGAILYLPDPHCPTADVYAAYKANSDQPFDSAHGPEPVEGQSAVSRQQLDEPVSEWRGELFNDLQAAAMRVCPPLAEIFYRLAEATGLSVHLTGSGSAMFIICDDANEAESVIVNLPDEMKNHCRAVSLNSW